jgi:hypothetical protein
LPDVLLFSLFSHCCSYWLPIHDGTTRIGWQYGSFISAATATAEGDAANISRGTTKPPAASINPEGCLRPMLASWSGTRLLYWI